MGAEPVGSLAWPRGFPSLAVLSSEEQQQRGGQVPGSSAFSTSGFAHLGLHSAKQTARVLSMGRGDEGSCQRSSYPLQCFQNHIQLRRCHSASKECEIPSCSRFLDKSTVLFQSPSDPALPFFSILLQWEGALFCKVALGVAWSPARNSS